MLVRLLSAALLLTVVGCTDPPAAEVADQPSSAPRQVDQAPDAVPDNEADPVAAAPTPPATGIPTAAKPVPEKGSGW